MTFKAAAIQMCSGVNPEKNAADMARLVREAAAKGAVYVQTPEMTGAVQKDRAGLQAVLKDEANDVVVRTAAALAKELGIYLHVGSTAIGLADGKIANRGFLFGPDGRTRHPLRQDPYVRRRPRQWRELARKRCLQSWRRGAHGIPALCGTRLFDLL